MCNMELVLDRGDELFHFYRYLNFDFSKEQPTHILYSHQGLLGSICVCELKVIDKDPMHFKL